MEMFVGESSCYGYFAAAFRFQSQSHAQEVPDTGAGVCTLKWHNHALLSVVESATAVWHSRRCGEWHPAVQAASRTLVPLYHPASWQLKLSIM
jgi:hypothetical protein